MIPTVKKGLKPVPGNLLIDRKKELIYLTSQRNNPRVYFPLSYMDFFKMLTFGNSKSSEQ